MPLQDAVPVIDDRRYDQLLSEIRTRIARYTPEWTPVWTDVNDSDPGITLAQLVAWMTELLTYRLGKVPELNYIKFLQLLGIELNAAEPARAQVAFPVGDAFTGSTVIVPLRTQVSANPPGGGPPLIFETDRALIAVAAKLAAVLAYDGYAYSDVTAMNAAAADGFEPFGPLAGVGAALLLGFDAPGGFPETELDLTVWAAPIRSRPAPALCGLGSTPAYAPAMLRWEGFDGKEWQPLTPLKDDTRGFTRDGHIYLKTPPAKTLQPAALTPFTPTLTWLRATLVKSQYSRPPALLAVRTNTVPVTQAETLRDEVLGGSNGRRDQVFQLANTPVIADSLRLEIDEGDGFIVWTRVDDFFASGPGDRHFVLDRTSGQVRLGDGINGAIAVANPDNADANVVAREYRSGGGQAGNLPAGAISTLATPVDGIDDSLVANLFASSGGRDEETLDSAKRRAPGSIKSRCRAVTADDYEYLAAQAADVERAKALPLYHPDFPGVRVPGVVTVIVVPDAGPDNRMPIPSEATLRTVCAYLDQRRLLTAEVYVIPPTYQRVEIQGEVVAEESADLAEVHDSIESALLTYFHPLTGGEDGNGWPFGGTIHFSRVYQRVMSLPGVHSLQNLTIVVDGQPAPNCTDVPLAPEALAYSTRHEVQVVYSST